MTGSFEVKKASADSSENSWHKLSFEVDKDVVATLQYTYHSKPFPFYFFKYLDVVPVQRGKGYGRKVMTYVQEWLDKKGKAGVLVDSIDDIEGNDPRAYDMYERGGWKRIPGTRSWFAYNVPESASLDQLTNVNKRPSVWRNS